MRRRANGPNPKLTRNSRAETGIISRGIFVIGGVSCGNIQLLSKAIHQYFSDVIDTGLPTMTLGSMSLHVARVLAGGDAPLGKCPSPDNQLLQMILCPRR